MLTEAEANAWVECYLTRAQAPFLWLVAERAGGLADRLVA